MEHAWDCIAVNSFLGRLSGMVKCWGEAWNFHDVSCRDFRETSVFDVRDSAHDGCGQFEMPADAAANAAITPMRSDANAVKMAFLLLHRLLAHCKLLQALLEGLRVVV